MFCPGQAAQLRAYIPRIRAAGGELVVVGNGSAEQARTFAAKTSLDAALYTDPTLAVYRAFGAHRGWSNLVWYALNILGALRRGFITRRVLGDPAQQGGVFVVTQAGEVVYSYVSKVAGDHPDPEQAVRAVSSPRARDARRARVRRPAWRSPRGEAGAPGRSRTFDPRFRKPLLYPLSYEGTGFRIVPGGRWRQLPTEPVIALSSRSGPGPSPRQPEAVASWTRRGITGGCASMKNTEPMPDSTASSRNPGR